MDRWIVFLKQTGYIHPQLSWQSSQYLYFVHYYSINCECIWYQNAYPMYCNGPELLLMWIGLLNFVIDNEFICHFCGWRSSKFKSMWWEYFYEKRSNICHWSLGPVSIDCSFGTLWPDQMMVDVTAQLHNNTMILPSIDWPRSDLVTIATREHATREQTVHGYRALHATKVITA